MKHFRNLVTAALVGIMLLALAGCDGNGGASTKSSASGEESKATVSEQASQSSEVASSSEETSSSETGSSSETASTSEQADPAHVEVTTQLEMMLTDDNGNEFRMIIPKLIVDGKEATAINAALKEFIEQNHPLERTSHMDGDTEKWYVDGEETSYEWGVKGNMVSIVIQADETFTDGFRYDIFNYNVDTLEAASNEEVIRAFGMTVDEFNGKVADAYRAYWESETYHPAASDLDKSIDPIPTSAIPYITPNGTLGAAGLIYDSNSQFDERTKFFEIQ